MPHYFKLEGNALEAVRGLKDNLYARAQKELKLRKEGLVDRDLRPEDIGLSNPVWTFNVSSSSAWNTLVNAATIADNRFVGIYGVLIGVSGTAAVTQLRITRAGQKKRYWQIQDGNFREDATIYFDDPIIVDQNTTITIEGYATATDSTFRLTFLGMAVEKKGVLIQ